ncbi:hypothetical protein QBC37DRAFT_424708 [Rhypophila decipiens]|uniref:Uncharacterized protein n=1 Tax=Rhypophila decipiens TaxID=261697 RepID=A0AAN7B6C6_9PEZI|nr:hypothetical protein QBC37DRAFT_424708 [Rhypophila decipiens]
MVSLIRTDSSVDGGTSERRFTRMSLLMRCNIIILPAGHCCRRPTPPRVHHVPRSSPLRPGTPTLIVFRVTRRGGPEGGRVSKLARFRLSVLVCGDVQDAEHVLAALDEVAQGLAIRLGERGSCVRVSTVAVVGPLAVGIDVALSMVSVPSLAGLDAASTLGVVEARVEGMRHGPHVGGIFFSFSFSPLENSVMQCNVEQRKINKKTAE